MNSKSEKSDQGLKGVAPYFDLGLRFALAIAIGTYGGYWLDSKLNTLPLFLIIGLLLGAVSGFLTIYRAVYSRDSTKTRKRE